jgi:pimeloyl-ACP methyl ester carboxylesterase
MTPLMLCGHRPSARLLLVVLLGMATGLLLSLVARPAAAQPASFVYLQGTDTIAIETVTPGNDVVKGVLAYKGQPRIEWEQQRTPLRLTMHVFAPGADANAAPMQVASFIARGDSMAAEIGMRGAMRPQLFASQAGAVAYVNNSVLHGTLLSQIARSQGRTTLPVFLAMGGQTLEATVQFVGDTTIMTVAGMPMRIVWQNGVPREITIAAQNLRVIRADRLLGAPPVETIDYSAPAGAPYTAEPVIMPTTRGYALAGTLTKPTGATKVPVVITISGSGPQERDSRLGSVVRGYAIFREVADTLGRRGIAVLRYDDRGVGESGGADSRAKATSADFADDVLSVVAYLRTRPDIDASRIVVAGHSEGGLIGPLAAAKDPALRAVVMMAGPAYDGRRVLRYQIGNQFKALAAANSSADSGLANARTRGENLERYIARRADQMIDSMSADPWMRAFVNGDPKATLRTLRQPVLVLQGETDMQVTPEQADTVVATLKAAGNTKVTMRRFPETNHLFLADPSGVPGGYAQLKDVRVRREVLGTLADWVVQIVK